MNISHLIGKRVCVVQYSHCGSEIIIQGNLLRTEGGKFIVFSTSLFFYFLRSLFFKQNNDTFITFPWTAVTSCVGNSIFIFDITDEQLMELAEQRGVVDLIKEVKCTDHKKDK